ncbi:MAG: hypothetical protein U0401_27160 [Anaerolineae bacterium]
MAGCWPQVAVASNFITAAVALVFVGWWSLLLVGLAWLVMTLLPYLL